MVITLGHIEVAQTVFFVDVTYFESVENIRKLTRA